MTFAQFRNHLFLNTAKPVEIPVKPPHWKRVQHSCACECGPHYMAKGSGIHITSYEGKWGSECLSGVEESGVRGTGGDSVKKVCRSLV